MEPTEKPSLDDRGTDSLWTEDDEFHQSIIEHSPLGISVRDPKGKFLSVNQAWCQIWQIPLETVEKYKSTDRTSPEFGKMDSYLGEWLPKVEKIYREGGRLTVPELRVAKHRSGEIRWISQTFYAIVDQGGAVDRVVTLTNDITSRKITEEALQKSEEIFRTIVTNAQPIIFMIDAKGDFVLSEGKMLASIGLKPGQAVGASALELYKDYPDVVEALKGALEGRSSAGQVVVEDKTFDTFFEPYRLPDGDVGGVIGMAIDITEHKQAEGKLSESEDRFRNLFENAPLGYQSLDIDGNLLEVNETWCKMMGYTPDEVVGRNFSEFLLPDFQEHFRERFPAFKGIGYVLGVEFEMITKDGEEIIVTFDGRIGRDIDGSFKQTHCVLTDITERKHAEQALIESEERYRNFFDNALTGLFRTRISDGLFLEVNSKAAEQMGVSADEIVGKKHAADLYQDPRQREELVAILLRDGEVDGFEVDLTLQDGRDVTFSISVKAHPHKDYMEGAVIDITDRKRAETALSSSQAQYEQLFKGMNDGFALHEIICDETGKPVDYRFLAINPAFERLTGLKGVDLIGRTVKEVVPGTEPTWIERYGAVALTGKAAHFEEFSASLNKHFEVNAYRPADGQFACIFVDITDRKQAEQALRVSEEKHRGLLEHLPQRIFNKDVNSVYISCNENYANDFGIGADVITGKTDFDLYPKERAEKYRAEDRRVMESGQAQEIEESLFRDGQEIFSVTVKTPLTDEYGNVTGILGIFWDITDRKRAEEGLRKSEERFRALFERMPSCVAVYEAVDDGTDFVFKDFNTAGERVERIERGDLIGKRVTEVFAGVKESGIFDTFLRVWKTGKAEFYPEALYLDEHDSGSWRENWVYRLPSGDVVAVYNDISERMQAEVALRESEAALAQAQRVAHIGSWDWLPLTGEMNWSDEVFRIYGYEPQECPVAFEMIFDRIHPDDRTRVREVIEESIGGGDTYDVEYRIQLPDGRIRTVMSISKVRTDESGKTKQYYGTTQDITDRKLAEEALRASEERHRNLSENLPQRIYHKDASLVYVSCNQHYARDLGVDPDEIAGKTDFDFYPWEVAEKHREDDRRLLESGEPVEIEESYVKDGEECFVHTVRSPLTDDTGSVVGILGIFWDITKRRRAEEQLESTAAFLDEIVDMSPFAMWVSDSEGTMIRSNRSLRETLNLTDEQLIGKYNVLKDDNLVKQGLMSKVKTVFDNHESVRFSMTWTASDGGDADLDDGPDYYIYLSMFPIVNAQGELTNVVCQWIDISERKRAEEALRESEQFSRAIIENSPLGVSVRSPNGLLLSVNKAWRDIWQIDEETVREYMAADPDDLRLDDRDAYLGKWQADVVRVYREGGMAHIPEMRLDNHRSYDQRWVSQTFYAIMDKKDQVDRVVVLTNDITERKRAAEALVTSQAQLEELFNTVQEGICIVDENEVVRFANPACAVIFEEDSIDLIINRSLLDYVPQDQLGLLRGQTERRKAAEASRYEIDIATGGANRKTILVSVSPRLDQDGKYLGAVGAVLDISERKRAENTLRTSEERLDLAMSVANDGMYDWDLRTNSTYFDPRFYTMAGYEPNEFPGTFDEWAQRVHPDDFAQADAAIRAFLAEDIPTYDTEFRFRCKNGDWMWIRARGIVVGHDENGAPLRLVGTHSDITVRKFAEEAMRESEQRLELLSEAAFEGILIHEGGTLMGANPQFFKMCGYEPDELLNKQFIPMILAPEAVDEVNQIIAEHRVEPYETIGKRKDGTHYPMEVRVRERQIRGKTLRMAAVQDISARKAAEQAMVDKNIALREVLGQIQSDKERMRQQIADNLEDAVLPTLLRLRESASPTQVHLLDMLDRDLMAIASPFLDTLKQKYATLTPRETELCRLIRGGMSSKEMAEALNLSLGTIHKHREMIRRKLGLANEEVNLTTFLKSM